MKINLIIEKELDTEIRRIRKQKKPKLLTSFQNKIKTFHEVIQSQASSILKNLSWLDFHNNINHHELSEMKKIVKKLQSKKVNVLVVITSAKVFLGIKAAIDFVFGNLPLESKNKKNMEVIFIENCLSSTELVQKLNYVKGKNFAINLISKSGNDFEIHLAFRFFKNLLIRQFHDDIVDRVFVTTTLNHQSVLKQMANLNNFKLFSVETNTDERFQILSPIGLFPMLCAGINIKKLIQGAAQANAAFNQPDVRINLAYQYAAARYLLYKKKGISAEILIGFEPFFASLNNWWRLLFASSNTKLTNNLNKNNNEEKIQDLQKEYEDFESLNEENTIEFEDFSTSTSQTQTTSLLPVSAIFTTDIYTYAQFLQEGSKLFFETLMFIKEPIYDILINEEQHNIFRKDQLDKYAQKTVHEVNKASFWATVDAHSISGNIPQIILKLEDNSPETFGWLVIFFQRACIMSSFLLGTDPFDETIYEIFRKKFNNLLEKEQKIDDF
ncbi:glucose-6-phosphate isomerase [Mycoplasma hyorhinis]|uniref:glucose-6-phosphate isomerase n=1 Tax=Mesomycoplasma hyorhinis TaxID=2100 RepID=UPI0013696B0D|nr:glucose-6-phosphate isomerase [Mesomycoplasma hyorhinis]MXR08613.1 glucose-6-phosphate isomerase [Mesomycoplasma hyorhinis]